MSNVLLRIKHVAHLLHPDDVVLMPKDLKTKRAKYLIFSIVITAILDIISMSVKGATFAIEHKWVMLAFMLLILYYLRQSLTASTKVFLDSEKQRINAKSENYVNSNIIKVSNAVRGKVYSKTESGTSEVMQNSEIIFQMNNYIRIVWEFWNTFPTAIANCITLLLLAFSMVYMEWIDTKDPKVTLALTILLIICAACYVIVTKLRMKVRSRYRKDFQYLRKKSEKVKDTLKIIEPVCEEEFDYRANTFLDLIDKINIMDLKQTKSFNFLYVFRSLVVATFMCIILFIKIKAGGGISMITTATIAEVIALGAIYETILDKIVNILRYVEDIINSFKDLEDYSTDFDNILSTYNNLSSFETINSTVDQVTVECLEHEYPKKESAYKLKVCTPFVLEKGKCYLLAGPTGCGKSTLISLICGKLLLTPSPISYGSRESRGYLASLIHETNGRLGTEFVLNEIIFSNDTSSFDRAKLIEILRGLTLYENIQKNLGLREDNSHTEEMVLEYLARTNIEEYSAGQKQRLAIAKLLYNLKPRHQIIAFDEATNALDSETTIKVLNFIKEFCMRDCNRIILFASHQVEEMKHVVDEGFTFSQENFPTSEVVRMDMENA